MRKIRLLCFLILCVFMMSLLSMPVSAEMLGYIYVSPNSNEKTGKIELIETKPYYTFHEENNIELESFYLLAISEYSKRMALSMDDALDDSLIQNIKLKKGVGDKGTDHLITNKRYTDTLGHYSWALEDPNAVNLREDLVTVEVTLGTNKFTFGTYSVYMRCVVGEKEVIDERDPETDEVLKSHWEAVEDYVPKTRAGQLKNLELENIGVQNQWEGTMVVETTRRGGDTETINLSADEVAELLELEGHIAENTITMLEELADSVRTGLVVGSVGSGYNVGTIYSDKQVSLTTVMSEQKNSGHGTGLYDFNGDFSINAAFEYYMNPLLGKLTFKNKDEVPKTAQDWKKIVKDKLQNKDFVVGNTVNINTDFQKFDSELNKDGTVNYRGLKITDSERVTFTGGVQGVTDVTSRTPKSVVSYNVHITCPFLFMKMARGYQLDTDQLCFIDELTYCLATDKFYLSTDDGTQGELYATTKDLELHRENLYLYRYKDKGEKKGAILIAEFHECVKDTKEDITYATGRNIIFTGAYSEGMNLTDKKVENLFCIDVNYKITKVAYPLQNIAFKLSASELQKAKNNASLHSSKQEIQDNLILDKNYVKDSSNHSDLNEPEFIKLCLDFEEIKNPVAEDISDIDKKSFFVVYRNNAYVNDTELLSWLRSDEVKGISYVAADELISKITGVFNLTKISYEAFKKMEHWKSYVEWRKENMITRVMNISAIVLGTFLIIIAVIYCILYWIDIFSPSRDISLLYVASFRHLYPVENRDDMLARQNQEGTKYVTFQMLLIRMFFLVALACLLFNLTFVIYVLYSIYSYIMYVFTIK